MNHEISIQTLCRRLRPAALAVALLLAVGAAADGVSVQWQDSTSLRLAFTVTDGKGIGSNYSVWATPMLTNGRGDTLRLGSTVFRGKRNARLTDRARYYGEPVPQPSGYELPAGATADYAVTISRADAPWLWQGRVSLDTQREREGCCEVESLPAAHIGRFAYVPPFRPALALVPDNTGKAGELQRDNPVLQHISQYKPYDGVIRRGALFVHFPLDKHVLRHDFRDNAATLDRIIDITRAIMADTTSAVKVIQIVGLASIDGPRRHNIELAGNRVRALKDYIQRRVATPDSLYEVVNGGEGWRELRAQIAGCSSPYRDRLLSIIDNEPDPDRREQLIKRLDGRRAWRWLRDSVLADQRNSGYLRIYYDYVPDTAARIINRAIGLLRQGRHAEALALLRTVSHDDRAQNALGVACFYAGNREEALSRLTRAADSGDACARENLRQLRLIAEAERLND